jgi:hypothetical protein
MSSEDFPQTETSGELVPPPRKPPTAIEAAAPLPPPEPGSRAIVRYRSRTISLFPALAGFVASLLDAADVVADSLAEELGLRERNKEPSPPTNIP